MGLPPHVDKADSADTDTDTLPVAVDTPEDTPPDTPLDPDAVGRAGGQGCVAAVQASDGAYTTVACLASWTLPVGGPTEATDGSIVLQPGALRRIVP